jgi:hypothetical protein
MTGSPVMQGTIEIASHSSPLLASEGQVITAPHRVGHKVAKRAKKLEGEHVKYIVPFANL